MPGYGFHPEALLEYAEATNFYLEQASVGVAESFVAVIESAIASIIAAPTRWRAVEQPDIRRYVCHRFPYVIYYRWETKTGLVTIYAVMHCRREPGYWKTRVA
jgi:toxin ParE1/3/4